ncbi:hypothetical protein VOWphi5012_022 [Vibrio phage phi50-12]|uniref:Uncharacterized protein n=1 Tax=Vibrio phage phi50-12 TaxID=2654972 RepID=A0A5P8PRB6_9CAUD|nr:hypothetical protein KNU82_gp022 [Vibrio phage phi50-12]QFR59806.1 hypothetical protein VOWphi5012_022 [Vibrio phage phi50-12]
MKHTALIQFKPEAFKLYDLTVDTHLDESEWVDGFENELDSRLIDITLLPDEPVRVVLKDNFMHFTDNPHIEVRWANAHDEDGNYNYFEGPAIAQSFGGVTYFDVIMTKPLEE